MSNIKVQGNVNGTGSLTIAAPNTNTDRTLTLPDESGTLLTDSGAISVSASAPDNSLNVAASGNLGVGTSSPSVRTEVGGTDAIVALRVNTQNSGNSSSNYSEFQLADVGTVRSYWRNMRDGSGATILSYNDHLRLSAQGVEKVRIDSSGNLLVRTTSVPNVATGGTGFSVSATELVFSSNTNGGNSLSYWRTQSGNSYISSFWNGNSNVGNIAVTTTTTTYNTSSDYRLKNTIAPMTGALAKVAALKPVTYKWNADGSDGEGFIAHELAEVVPQCVTGEKDAVDADGKPVYQGIDTSFLVATLTAAIQELKVELDTVKAELAAMKGTV